MPRQRCELVGDELAQAAIALRPLRQAVQRQVLPLAAQHRRGRLDQPLDRDQAAVVVAADEIVFGVAGPARRRRRHLLAEQVRIGETGAAHCNSFVDRPAASSVRVLANAHLCGRGLWTEALCRTAWPHNRNRIINRQRSAPRPVISSTATRDSARIRWPVARLPTPGEVCTLPSGIGNFPIMIELPNEAGPAAEFLVRHLYQQIDVEPNSCYHAIAETAASEDDKWFWHDDNAKVLEFMSRPEVWRRFPTESSEILRFVGSMCRGPFIFRRMSAPRLEAIASTGSNSAIAIR